MLRNMLASKKVNEAKIDLQLIRMVIKGGNWLNLFGMTTSIDNAILLQEVLIANSKY